MIIYSTPNKHEPITPETLNTVFLMDIETIIYHFNSIFTVDRYKPFPKKYIPKVSCGFEAMDPIYKSITSYNKEKKEYNKNSCKYVKLKTDKEILENINIYLTGCSIFFIMEKNFFGGVTLNIINIKDKIIEIYKIKNLKKFYSYLYCFFYLMTFSDIIEGIEGKKIPKNLEDKKIIIHYINRAKYAVEKENKFYDPYLTNELRNKTMNLTKQITYSSSALVKKIISNYKLEISGTIKNNIKFFN